MLLTIVNNVGKLHAIVLCCAVIRLSFGFAVICCHSLRCHLLSSGFAVIQ